MPEPTDPFRKITTPQTNQSGFDSRKNENNSDTYKTMLGIDVRISSHLAAHNDVSLYIPKILEKIDFAGYPEDIQQIVHLDQITGKSMLVKTFAGDDVVYAKRKGRYLISKFVKGKIPQETSFVAAYLEKEKEGNGYVLLTAYFGDEIPPPEPGDKKRFDSEGDGATKAEESSFDFWNGHALCYEQEKELGNIEPNSERPDCPWQRKYKDVQLLEQKLQVNNRQNENEITNDANLQRTLGPLLRQHAKDFMNILIGTKNLVPSDRRKILTEAIERYGIASDAKEKITALLEEKIK